MRDLLAGLTDIHLHLLPGVDDGAQDEADVTALLKCMENVGVKHIVCTPHIMIDYPLNNKKNLQERFNAFCSLLPPGIECHLAAEYMLDSAFALHFQDGLLTYDGRRVLLETSYFAAPYGFEGILYEIELNGYQPVLAHPERYLYMDKEMYLFLKRRGCSFQLNLLSVCGHYGKEVQERSKWLLGNQFYDFVGTDIHREKQYDAFSYPVSLKLKNQLMKLIEQNNLLWQSEKTGR